MGNLGGGEILVILLVALIVLGPTKLPPAIRQVGKVVGEIRRIGQGFQQELREAAKPLQEATADLRAADKRLRETTQKPLKEMSDTLKAADPRKAIAPPPAAQDKGKEAATAKDSTKPTDGGKSDVASGPVSWGTAAASVSAPPAATGGEDADAAADAGADGPDAVASEAGQPDPDAVASEAGQPVPDAVASEAAVPASDAVASEAEQPDPDAVASEAGQPDPESRADGAA